jgi:hypothetical protein
MDRGRQVIRILRIVGIALAVGVVLIGVIALAARLSDGPLGPFAGGPLTSGELVDTAGLDWSFAADVDTIEFQLLEPPRSRSVGIVVDEGTLYTMCFFPAFRAWKQWPHEVAADGRALLRIEGKRYPVQAVRVTEEPLLSTLQRTAREKYGGPEPDSVWIFRFDPRSA